MERVIKIYFMSKEELAYISCPLVFITRNFCTSRCTMGHAFILLSSFYFAVIKLGNRIGKGLRKFLSEKRYQSVT